jgi:hypothetical protein
LVLHKENKQTKHEALTKGQNKHTNITQNNHSKKKKHVNRKKKIKQKVENRTF